jgi:cytochrome d ubiquinol oxidase subunit I
VLAPLQALVGDLHGLNTLEHQPAKIAAMEAIWQTRQSVPLVLFAIPNEKTRRNDYAIEVPKLASYILKHDFDAELKGLDAFGADHPPVAPVFFAFRGMVGMGVLMIAVAWTSFFLLRKKSIPRWWLWVLAGFTFSGWVATLCGWLVTEIGRQPWLVTGILRTADARGTVTDAQLGASLTVYLITYVLMFIAYMVVLTHLAGKGSSK